MLRPSLTTAAATCAASLAIALGPATVAQAGEGHHPAADASPTAEEPSETDSSSTPATDHEDMPGMDHEDMPGMDHEDMPGMDHDGTQGTDRDDMPGMDHEDGSTGPSSQQRAWVLGGFASVNGVGMAGAFVLRRRTRGERDRKRRARQGAGTPAAGDSARGTGTAAAVTPGSPDQGRATR